MSRQYFHETLAWATTDGTAVANTVTETIIFPNVNIPANYMNDGRRLKLRAIGKWSTGTPVPSLIFTVRWGGVAGTVLAKTAAITLVVSTTNAMWDLDVELQTRSNGATGSIMANGVARVFAGVAPTVAATTGSAAVTPLSAGGVLTPAAVTVDLTADTALALTATWSAAVSGHTLTGLNYALESPN
jgi:hypothetical protein